MLACVRACFPSAFACTHCARVTGFDWLLAGAIRRASGWPIGWHVACGQWGFFFRHLVYTTSVEFYEHLHLVFMVNHPTLYMSFLNMSVFAFFLVLWSSYTLITKFGCIPALKTSYPLIRLVPGERQVKRQIRTESLTAYITENSARKGAYNGKVRRCSRSAARPSERVRC